MSTSLVANPVIDVGILTDRHITAVQVKVQKGGYALQTDGVEKARLSEGQQVTFRSRNGMVEVEQGGSSLGMFHRVELMGVEFDAVFRVTNLHNKAIIRVYDDDLQVSGKSSSLLLINRVNLEKYVAGVVESESGKGHTLTYYKVQAIISRTYALNNLRKLRHLGYNLNDLVDCQVYHGKNRFEPLIEKAVNATRGMVLADANLDLITAAYHSNSGGETVDVEEVWTLPRAYLRGRIDTFSVAEPHYDWQKKVHRDDWLSYLKKKHQLPLEDELLKLMATNYKQDRRHTWFIDRVLDIRLEDVRHDWDLRSTYFDIEPVAGQDSLLFQGRGFGHGIGLSQEGAMKMARKGYSFKEILFYYYTDVHLVDYELVEMMRAD